MQEGQDVRSESYKTCPTGGMRESAYGDIRCHSKKDAGVTSDTAEGSSYTIYLIVSGS